MIRHLVLFKLNDGVARDEPRVVAGVRAWEEMAGEIPEVVAFECAWNISDRPIAQDFAINTTVEDQEALGRYLKHPAHEAGAVLWREFATWVIADYEI